MTIHIGNHVVHREQQAWGVGRVVGASKDALRLLVRFAGRPREELQVAARDPALVRHRFSEGDEVKVRAPTGDIVRASVVRAQRGDIDELWVAAPGVSEWKVSEKNAAAFPPGSGAVEALIRGTWDDARHWLLRQSTLRLDVERRCDGLGALFSSRVMVKPYQVAVAQRVLSDRSPRYVLADEVGLGKTIEAGMVVSALLHARLARRILIVAPAHLAVQWLAELRHKFNLDFTLFDGERLEAEAKADPDGDPWNGHDLVITTLELLVRNARAREAAGDADNRWDMVVIDEAHHLRGDKAFDAAATLSTNTWGLLLLTATPLKLDPEEYFRLLRLVESAPAQEIDDFVQRLERQHELSALVRALEEAPAREVAAKAKAVAELFPRDEKLAALVARVGKKEEGAREALLDHVADVYSLSARLIRNRRAVVGGFTERRLHRIEVAVDKESLQLNRDVHEALQESLKAGTLPQGAPLAALLRRLDSSPPALAKALDARSESALKMLAKRAQALAGVARDPKLRALRDKLREIGRLEPGSKVLVFAESRETLEYLVTELTREGLTPLWYHGDLPTIERDRMVARFRDPEGPRVLVSTEAGGEGRNFQFCHHLVHFDLPWSPSAIEQRIGRLDRVGQSRPVEIHVLRSEGTLAQRVLDLFADDVQVFTQTVGGLDAVLEEVEGEIVRLATTGGERAWKSYGQKLGKAVRAAREAMQRDYDPLLDRRSFDRDRVARMLERAHERAGLDDGEFDTKEGLEESLLAVARDLDERLEDTVLQIARKLGIGVDSDENVDAFQCRLTLGSGMLVDALAGVDLDEESVVEGTFWRDTAVEREEIEYLATGHPLVESLVNFVRDGQFGRSTALRVKGRGRPALGAIFSFLVQLPEPEDLAQGSHVPSRQAERLLENVLVRVGAELAADGSIQVRDSLVRTLDDASRVHTLRPEELPLSAARREQSVRALEAAARAEARARLETLVLDAIRRHDDELSRRLDRLSLDAGRSDGQERILRAAEMVQEQQFANHVRDALRSARLVLDSASLVVVEPAPAAPGRAP